MRKSIAVFARAPVPGQVKTRLATHLGNDAASRLYTAMLRDTLSLAQDAARVIGDCGVVLCYTPRDAFEIIEYSLNDIWSGAQLAQCDGDLGARMLGCITQLKEQGSAPVVLIGSDTPDMPPQTLVESFQLLRNNELVLCRTGDGGFSVIGTSAELPVEVFSGVEWSTETVFARVAANAARLKMQWAHFCDGHDDLDTFHDLQNLARRLSAEESPGKESRAQNTAQWLASEGAFYNL